MNDCSFRKVLETGTFLCYNQKKVIYFHPCDERSFYVFSNILCSDSGN